MEEEKYVRIGESYGQYLRLESPEGASGNEKTDNGSTDSGHTQGTVTVESDSWRICVGSPGRCANRRPGNSRTDPSGEGTAGTTQSKW